VLIRNAQGGEIGRGLVGYDAGHASRIIGHNSRQIAAILGIEGRLEMIHRDDMALAGDALA
jgi:glutamate 5-kinase